MQITIAYITSRLDPKFSWFCESLARQTTPEEREAIQLMVIDRHLWYPGLFNGAKEHTEWIKLEDAKYHNPVRRRYATEIVAGRFNLLHLPPKPNVYAGPWRLTKDDWFCAANSRNTVFLYAAHPYVVCVDDLSVLMPGWWNQVKHAASSGYCVCGAYKKVLELVVDGGDVVSYKANLNDKGEDVGLDSRWANGSDTGIVDWSGAGLFGCSFGVPLNLAVRIDGFASETNGLGMEDFEFGIRADRAGGIFKYNRNMLTLESEECHHTEPSLRREQRLVTNPLMIPPGYDSYRHGDPAKKFDADHLLLNRLRQENDRIKPLLPESVALPGGLAAARAKLAADGVVNVPREPEVSWIDLKPLKEL